MHVFGLLLLCSVVVISPCSSCGFMSLLIFLKFTSPALGQSHDCPSAGEVSLKNMGKINHYLSTTKHGKTWAYKVCLYLGKHCLCITRWWLDVIVVMLEYGVSYESCKLIKSYLCNRLQRVKVASTRSEWAVMPKGVPQGSVIGPLLFNIFLNDIFYSFKNVCSLYNYADDNTISCYSHDMNVLKEQLEANAKLALDWFAENQMKANPSKFQTIIFKHRSNEAVCELNISNDTIKPVSCVKLLGVTLDDKLCFDDHISRLCTRAASQTNAFRRILKYVTLDCRINIYNAFIASNFNYCKTVWHFCSNRSAYKIE